MGLALAGAGTSLAAAFFMLGVPAIDACRGHQDGLLGCLRARIDDRFDLGQRLKPAPQPNPVVPLPPPVSDRTEVPVIDGPAQAVAVPETVDSANSEDSEALPIAVEQPAAPAEAQAVEDAAAKSHVAETAVKPDAAAGPDDVRAAAMPSDTAHSLLFSVPEPEGLALLSDPPIVPASEPEAVVALPELMPAPIAPALSPPPDAIMPPASEPPAEQPGSVEVPLPVGVALLGSPPAMPVQEPDIPPMPPVLTPDPLETGSAMPQDVAANSPLATAPDPEVVLPPELPPTIDTIELGDESNIIAGSGPAGAAIQLFVDDVLQGETSVEEGRWVIDGVDLFGAPTQMLRVEATDPETGKSLGSAAISLEIELPPAVEPAPEVPPTPDVPASPPAGGGAAAPQPELVVPADVPEQTTPLAPLDPVLPTLRSPSVTVLAPVETDIDTLPLPDTPASVQELGAVPEAAGADPPKILAFPLAAAEASRAACDKATIRPGDTLWSLSRRCYGHGIHYRTILRANRHIIGRPSQIFPGQVLDLPLVYDD